MTFFLPYVRVTFCNCFVTYKLFHLIDFILQSQPISDGSRNPRRSVRWFLLLDGRESYSRSPLFFIHCPEARIPIVSAYIHTCPTYF